MRTFLSYRKPLIIGAEACLIAFAYYSSFWLRFDFDPGGYYFALFEKTVFVVLVIKLCSLYLSGVLSGWWRYAGINDLINIVKASFLSSVLLFVVVSLAFSDGAYPRSVIVIDFVLSIVIIGGARFIVRAYTEQVGRFLPRKNVLIVGAGEPGVSLVYEIKRNSVCDYWPVGFVDDDPSKKGMRIGGIKVLGTVDDLGRLVERTKVEYVLITMPVRGRQISRVIEKCQACKVDFRILPDLNHRLNGHTAVEHVRSVRVEDLLRREPIRLNLAAISARLQGKTAVVTGAGGSIGSEIVRQLAVFKPKRVVLFERSENDLFQICSELTSTLPSLNYVPVVGDILDVDLLRNVFGRFQPESVFHAAAYKHVPMMEKNCFQAVTNNIFGSYNVALVARQHEVDDFVMISSDKAVNPTNIMGVTKRVAELIMLSLQDANTRFVAVRFGNVLGSKGSVLPTWEQQISRGGPVTVTHPDAKRYFMTIPEAVQLVLQASAMGHGGEIFVLDMGEPVQILSLAKDVIRLSGMMPEQDIPIVFTGLRPGEKLFEELSLTGEGMKATYHEKIRVLDGGKIKFQQVQMWLDELSALVESKNVYRLVTLLKEIVPEYTPSPEMIELCEVDRHDRCIVYSRSRAKLATPVRGAA